MVAPYLLDRGIQVVDVLVLSHSDEDHVNGLGSLLERIRVRRALLSPSFGWTETGRKVTAMLREAGVEVRYARRGSRIALREGMTVEVLNPGVVDGFTRRLTVNDSSVVLRIRSEAGCVQLWGDAETNVFRMLEGEEDLEAAVAVLPHHGSKVEPVMDRMLGGWERVIVSARESFVPRERLGALKRAGCVVYPTWRSGAVRVRLDGATAEVRTFIGGE